MSEKNTERSQELGSNPQTIQSCQKCKELARLLIESRDALPAISLISARLYGVDLTLAARIEAALELWLIPEGGAA